MLTISKPISAGQARAYHQEEFQNTRACYYTEVDKIRGEWHGQLAERWGLRGEVQEEHFTRLAEGQHPITGEQLVKHQTAREYRNPDGALIRTIEHRAGWDATFSAPKSVSLTALVGGDARVRAAHRESVDRALTELEKYVEARMGGNAAAVSTGAWVAAKFEHDSSRPVAGYVAPQLHTHVVFFNLTELENGETRPLLPRELYRTQQYATAIYRAELALRLRELGYETERGPSGAPEIRGYSPEYLEASSPRRQQIQTHLAEQGFSGAAAAQIAAHRTRDAKQVLTRAETLARHRELAATYGDQPAHVLEAAKARAHSIRSDREERLQHAQSAITFARDRNLEREAVVDERALLRDALKRAMGQASFEDLRGSFGQSITNGDLMERQTSLGRSFTTPEMVALEESNIRRMQAGQGQTAPLATTHHHFEHLRPGQRQAVEAVLASPDQIFGLQGVAGAGKTTSLAAIRVAVEREGYTVQGLAPTSRAAHQLEGAGMRSETLQHHLSQGARAHESAAKRLYLLDESSLASTRQVHEFFSRLRPNERVLLVGDTRQHQAVDAGKPFEQLQAAGMRTARLDDIVRQKEEGLKHVVEQLARGEVREALGELHQQGRVHEVSNREARLREIARSYAAQPEGTLVISPDNRSRTELNRVIHGALQQQGSVGRDEHPLTALVPRQDMTGVDRAWAGQYEAGDVVRYSKGSRTIGLGAGEYATVKEFEATSNLLTVSRADGTTLSYDPRRLQGVAVYRESERNFAEGDRVQFTAPDKVLRIANRDLGTIQSIDEQENVEIRLDSGRDIHFNLARNRHLDYGYAVTSHASQSVTAERVLIHIDSEMAHEKLINSRLAYVAVSRASHDVQIYTTDAANLGAALSREVSNASAISLEQPAAVKERGQTQPTLDEGYSQGMATFG